MPERTFKKYVEDFEQKHHAKLAWGETPWGREGETDYCFGLNMLSAHKKAQFIKGLKKLLINAPQVRVSRIFLSAYTLNFSAFFDQG